MNSTFTFWNSTRSEPSTFTMMLTLSPGTRSPATPRISSVETVMATWPAGIRCAAVTWAMRGSTNMPSTTTWLALRLVTATLPRTALRSVIAVPGRNSWGISSARTYSSVTALSPEKPFGMSFVTLNTRTRVAPAYARL